jgi:mono/diheme cytochrome c family protein
MKRLLRWVGIAVLVLVGLVAALVGYVYISSGLLMARTYQVGQVPHVTVRSDPASVARGKYLYEHVAACGECHGADLGGKVVERSFMMGTLASVNLTRGQGGVGTSSSDEDFVRALTHGVKRDGRSVIFMPSSDYQFTEADLGALLGYIRSVPPVDRTPPATAVGPMTRALGLFMDFPLAPAARIDHANVRLAAAPNAADAAASGAYLVSSAGCRSCHGANFTGGGGPPPGAANITPVGIGGWTEGQFLTAIRDHKRPNGTTITEAMPLVYGQMSDGDLHAVYAFLKTLPPAGEKTANQKKGN